MDQSIKVVFKVSATLVISFLSLLAVVIAAKLFGFDIKSIKDPSSALNFSSIVIVLCILLLPILITFLSEKFLHKNPSFLQDYFANSRINSTLQFFVIGFLLKLFATGCAFSLSPQADYHSALGSADSSWMLCFLWFWIALILNSLNEELIYRAYPIKKLTSLKGISPLVVVVLAAIIFSIMHFLIEEPDLSLFAYRTAFGLFAGVLFVKNKSLSDIIGLHTGWNLAALSFSGDTDWRMGGVINTTGVIEAKETVFNIILLLGAFLFVLLLERSKRLKQ